MRDLSLAYRWIQRSPSFKGYVLKNAHESIREFADGDSGNIWGFLRLIVNRMSKTKQRIDSYEVTEYFADSDQ